MMVEKKCVVCGKNFDAKGRKNTCSDKCRKIRKKNMKAKWYQNNKDYIKNIQKQWYQNNREKILSYNKEYAQNNKEKIQKYQKQYKQDNQKKLQQYHKQYYRDNKEHIDKVQKKWYKNNKEHCKKVKEKYYQKNKKYLDKKKKEWYQNNRERILKKSKEYYQNNKEKIQQYNRKNRRRKQEYHKQKYGQAYKDLSKKSNISIKDLKKYLPIIFVQRELECWEYGSYFLDFVIPVVERANGLCEITGKKTNDLFVHHLNGYNWYIEGRMDQNNVVVICRELHDAFHKKYGKGNNTEEQFWEFVEEYKKRLVTLDDFKEGYNANEKS